MGLARLKIHKFSSAELLCSFVNDNGISVIEQIVIDSDNVYVLFYRE